jgi:hypothetical protein
MNAESLIKTIATVFPVANPPGANMVLYDGAYSGNADLNSIKSFFDSRVWNSVTTADVFHFRDAPSLFSKQALVYFLPAYLTASVSDPGGVDTAVEGLAGVLGSCESSLWSKEQRSAICEWLKLFRSELLEARFIAAESNFQCAAIRN